ncbi:DUF2997 domain-containing protein [Bacillus sp. CGMCC 1.16607]|uniref:DUF2997 domain-containing protein n=1 Tax=Bacillus sp. CGMCC 1.16607 TaxID=3351842 RepID=UPI003636298C
MKEVKIILTISEDGEISAETQGMVGSVCLDELEKLLDGVEDIESVVKTEEYYQSEEKANVLNKMNRSW